MKILAIRGRNLASLPGPFEIDLAAPPLARAGLFAITGPTGAGKSTILDALCLALFNRMPRLPTGGGVLLGREDEPDELRVRTTDARSVLRRGAASGYAEVDFEGGDGHRYRARWEVRRARDKAGGRLQAVTPSLTGLDDGRALGGTPSETWGEIERRLGLSFDQFRRAVLLAQGDFAAFLKAPAADRAELLEQITGTELYARLSVAAHERATLEKQRLGDLERQRDGFAVLDAEGRSALEATLAEAKTALTAAESAAQAAERARDWHTELARLIREAEDAAARHRQASEAATAAQAERAEVAALRRALPLRPALETSDRTAGEAAETAGIAQTGEEAAGKARTDHQGKVDALAEAGRTLGAAEAALAAAAPDLERAALLDHEISGVSGDLASAETGRQQAAERDAAARTALAGLDDALMQLAAELTGHRDWLAGHAALAPLAGQWPRWDSALVRAATADAALAASLTQRETLARQRAASAAGLPDLQRALLAAETALAEAQRGLAELRAQPAPALDGARAARMALEQWREALLVRRMLAEAAARTAAEIAAVAEETGRQRRQAADETALTAAAEAALALAGAALAEAQAALDRLRLARSHDVEALRAQLVPGQPCPVCGGTGHPWADGRAAALDELAHGQEARVAELRREHQALSQSLGGHRRAAAAAAIAAEALERRFATLATEAARHAAAWSAAPTDPDGLPPDPADATLPALLAGRLSALDAELTEARGREQAAVDHQHQLTGAGEAFQSAAADARSAADALKQRQSRLADLDHAAALAETEAARAERERDHALDELEAPCAGLDDWRSRRAADAAGFRSALQVQATAYRTAEEAQATASRRRDQLAADRQTQAARCEDSARVLAQAGEHAAGLAGRLGTLRDERRQLLGGRPVADVRGELTEACRRAADRQAEAADACSAAASTLAAAEQAWRSAAAEAERRRQLANRARADLEDKLAAAGLDEAELRRRLGRSDSWLEAAETRLAGLDRAVDDAAVRLDERQRQAADHRARPDAPASDAAETEAALTTARAALAHGRNRLAERSAALKADDEARRQRAALETECRTQRAAFVLWEALRAVIGSADGRKFRIFAQSLSLDQLLGHANRHLAELARRYRLERAGGADLELQVVDHDMAGEVRSVHSLSGGETFLISLALALGLSSMTGGGARIGTLFIDEGFGALDPDSLDVALSCLEALQAGGCTVGVVSHVPAMIERIGVQVRVIAEGGGRSRVATVQGCGR